AGRAVGRRQIRAMQDCGFPIREKLDALRPVIPYLDSRGRCPAAYSWSSWGGPARRLSTDYEQMALMLRIKVDMDPRCEEARRALGICQRTRRAHGGGAAAAALKRLQIRPPRAPPNGSAEARRRLRGDYRVGLGKALDDTDELRWWSHRSQVQGLQRTSDRQWGVPALTAAGRPPDAARRASRSRGPSR
ncbi:unnamed protein product, partial [Prorocentrum cordatum]